MKLIDEYKGHPLGEKNSRDHYDLIIGVRLAQTEVEVEVVFRRTESYPIGEPPPSQLRFNE